jgi:hypothetical protein
VGHAGGETGKGEVEAGTEAVDDGSQGVGGGREGETVEGGEGRVGEMGR